MKTKKHNSFVRHLAAWSVFYSLENFLEENNFKVSVYLVGCVWHWHERGLVFRRMVWPTK